MVEIGKNSIVIIDTGVCNLTSVYQAIRRLTDEVIASDDPKVITQAEKVVLPGVGAAQSGMQSITNKALIETIQQLTQPVLGICLGMQLLTQTSEESSNNSPVKGLGLIPTKIEHLETQGQPLPHMGWNQLSNMKHPIFDGIANNAFVYFVHSYGAPISDYTIASSDYGNKFSAAIAKDNFIGLQFHPEKSGKTGEAILNNFLNLRIEQ
ncbi:imidazole glycerol phosphate synthase subunit HisH [Parashewanella curva]|uniref:Imidazole glycerol phosphate synthase subunit HisH n=1 Tax=Parashewanella curva TaxID=2338552 RepID=A0A3L8PUZ6_9GAMM|nr:imidazole glycerol phosphate synthase subunit HisH [Parashewanella curva]RLV58403.1 imidazole glycerol phosphate synthase subunit HisH [Parashewanella curva]